MLPRFTLGDTLSLRKTLSAYPPGSGWVLHMRLLPAGAGSAIDVVGTADAGVHVLTAAAATTAAWAPGAYSWAQWVQHATLGSHTVDTGRTTLLSNPRTVTGPLDLRTEAETALENVRAMLRGRATQDVLRYTINGRSLERYSVSELVALESTLVAQLKRERRTAAAAAGRPDPRLHSVRLGRA